MGNNRPVKTKDWIHFLEAHGCTQTRHSGGSHEQWKCPGCWRTITHRSHLKEIPPMHLKTNLASMGKTLNYLYAWIENN